jgi:hypothetical protein
MFGAAFLKTADGDFDIGGLIMLLLGAWFALGVPFILLRFVRTRRIPFGYAGKMGSVIIWVERAKNPIGFWVVFAVWCLLVAAGIVMITCGWLGFGRSAV